MSKKFRIEQEELAEQSVTVLHLFGDLDAHSSRDAQDYMDDLADKKKFKLIVDMAGVKYMSSAGASVLLNSQSRARENDGNVVLMNVGVKIQQVMELLGIETLFDLTNDQNIALTKF